MSDATRMFLISHNLFAVAGLILLALMVEVGWRVGHYLSRRGIEKSDGASNFTAAIFGLLSLLIAIQFGGASGRYDQRRAEIIKEGLTIGTVSKSIDLLPAQDQPRLREALKRYLDIRIEMYRPPIDLDRLNERFAERSKIETDMWAAAQASVHAMPFPDKLIAAQILPAISAMSDASDTQRLSQALHPPRLIMGLLAALTIVGSLVSGYLMGIEKKRDWFLTILFVVLMAASFTVILDLEYPRLGFINLDSVEAELVSMRKGL
jgi:hypothetical protein